MARGVSFWVVWDEDLFCVYANCSIKLTLLNAECETVIIFTTTIHSVDKSTQYIYYKTYTFRRLFAGDRVLGGALTSCER